jgi:hypothetical protein
VPVFPPSLDLSALPWFLTTCLYFRRRRKAGGQESEAAGEGNGSAPQAHTVKRERGHAHQWSLLPGELPTATNGDVSPDGNVRNGRCAGMWEKQHTGRQHLPG